MAKFYCVFCDRETPHCNISHASGIAQVTRRTMYHWIDRALVHGRLQPSGRRMICVDSLSPVQRVTPLPIRTLSLAPMSLRG